MWRQPNQYHRPVWRRQVHPQPDRQWCHNQHLQGQVGAMYKVSRGNMHKWIGLHSYLSRRCINRRYQLRVDKTVTGFYFSCWQLEWYFLRLICGNQSYDDPGRPSTYLTESNNALVSIAVVPIRSHLFRPTSSDNYNGSMPAPAPIPMGMAPWYLCRVTRPTALLHKQSTLDHRRRTNEYITCPSRLSA